MLLRFFKNIKGGRICNRTSDNHLKLQSKPTSFLTTNPLHKHVSLAFNKDSFIVASLFIEHLIQNEENIYNLTDICQTNPTLTLDLHLISEAIATKKQLEEKVWYKDRNVLNLHIILTTPITATIWHGIMNTMRDSDLLPPHFPGQGIMHYFEKFDTHIHSHRKKGPVIHKFTHHPYQYNSICCCSKCKRLRHVHKDCCDYQHIRCYALGPGHTTPNCPVEKEKANVEERVGRSINKMGDW